MERVSDSPAPSREVRVATVDDAPEIVRLKREIMVDAYPFDVELDRFPDWPAKAERAVVEMIEHPDYVFFVIDGPDGLAGSISAGLERVVPGPRWHALHAHLGDMCTSGSARGTGLGRILMEAALDWCRGRGAQTVKLDATPSAVPVYERFGFERHQGPELFPTMRLTLVEPDAPSD